MGTHTHTCTQARAHTCTHTPPKVNIEAQQGQEKSQAAGLCFMLPFREAITGHVVVCFHLDEEVHLILLATGTTASPYLY